jgi:hypothetical protein
MQERQYDAVQATVLRKGSSILSEFLFIDTAFWFRQYIPFVLGIAKGMPLSGEGLFLRTSVLNEVGGFPEVLTEDGYLGIILTERNKRFGLLASTITEKAPKNMKAHFAQRLRWNRGYLTCLARLMRADLSLKRKLALSLPFVTPLSCSLAFLGWILIFGQWAVSLAGGISCPTWRCLWCSIRSTRMRCTTGRCCCLCAVSALHPVVSAARCVRSAGPVRAACLAAAVLLELHRLRRDLFVLQEHDALGQDGEIELRAGTLAHALIAWTMR